MAWSPDKVAALLSSRYGDSTERTAALNQVLVGIQDGGDEDLAAIVEKLADGARDGEFVRALCHCQHGKLRTVFLCVASWRLPLGDSGLLQHVLAAVPVKEPRHPLNKQALRLIGNACADCGK
jgi:hypothetical protein